MVEKGLPIDAQRHQGFITNTGRFVDRFEAFLIAEAAQQIKIKPGPANELFSEDVW
jgi:hypothetical protein